MLVSKLFAQEDQTKFAALTGDYNPMHMDPVAARRTQAGAPVVHGVHTLLWLLDSFAAHHSEIDRLTSLKVRFYQMVYVGDRVEGRITKLTSTSVVMHAYVDGAEIVSVVASIGAPGAAVQPTQPMYDLLPRRQLADELSFEGVEGRSGRVVFATDPAEMEGYFPNAARLLGAFRVAALGCSTYVVGMVVPGLHSIYGGLDLRFVDPPEVIHELQFSVVTVDPRFRRVQLRIQSSGVTGTLITFGRVPPVQQLPMAMVAEHVTPGEFSQTVALVVGGSRGLGELTAKIVAAGGGKVIITYAIGQADAGKLAAEINDWGGSCQVLSYDVRQDAERQLQNLKLTPTQLYYFATPRISRRKTALCTRERLDELNEFYIYGFQRLVEAVLRRTSERLDVFYPSSVFVQDRPADLTEYAMSKAAGEVLCADMARSSKQVGVLSERLPRLPTDQTASLTQFDIDNPMSVILPIVRKMHGQIREAVIESADALLGHGPQGRSMTERVTP